MGLVTSAWRYQRTGNIFLAMKTVGIIGGIGPESTIEYYRLIIAEYRKRQTDGSYPTMIINSLDLNRMVGMVTTNQLAALTEEIVSEIQKLARAGADFGVLAANTPHLVFDDVRRQSPIPLISIVEVTRDDAQRRGLKRVGLFGTRFTMQARFYPDVFSKAGISIIVPDEDEQAYIHQKYMNELLRGIILPETREPLLAIVDRMKERDGIEGLILGGTELPLILRDAEHNRIPFLDTTKIHVESIVAGMFS